MKPLLLGFLLVFTIGCAQSTPLVYPEISIEFTGTVTDISTKETPYQVKEELMMAFTIYGEARGESLEGKYAVAHVIWNRVKANRTSVEHEVLRHKQFSCWNIDDPNFKHMEEVFADLMLNKVNSKYFKMFMQYVMISKEVMSGKHTDTTLEANHYFNPTIVNPEWSTSMTHTVTIGNHKFYRS